MELKDFLKLATKRERAEVASACHDSVAYLYQLAGHHRFASAILATRIEQRTQIVAAATEGRLRPVSRKTLVRYPEIFHGIDDPNVEWIM